MFAALFTSVKAFGAESLVRVWQTEQGLPQNSVRCVLQTSDGYLWVGTEHGLARFDGVRFLSFNSANTPQFKSDHISALAEDESGNLWIGSFGGGVVQLSKSGFENFSTLNGLSSDMVNSLVSDLKGGIWIGTVYGLNYLKDGKISSAFSKEGLPGTDFKALAHDAKGAIWIGTDRGMASLRNGVFQPIQLTIVRFGTADGLPSSECIGGRQNSTLKDASGKLWFSTLRGLVRLDVLPEKSTSATQRDGATFRKNQKSLGEETASSYQSPRRRDSIDSVSNLYASHTHFPVRSSMDHPGDVLCLRLPRQSR